MSLFPHRLLIYGEYCSHMEHAQNTLNQLLASREDFRLKVEVKGLLGLSPARPRPVPSLSPSLSLARPPARPPASPPARPPVCPQPVPRPQPVPSEVAPHWPLA